MNRLAKITLLSFGAAALIAAPSFADDVKCIISNIENSPEYSFEGGEGTDYPVKCHYIKGENGERLAVYAKSNADCARLGAVENDTSKCMAAEDTTVAEPNENLSPNLEENTTNSTPETTVPETTVPEPAQTIAAPKKEDEVSVPLIISMVGNVVLFITTVVLIALLINKNKALAAADAAIASTQVIPPHGTQFPYTPKQ